MTSDFDGSVFKTPQRKTGMSLGGQRSPGRNRMLPPEMPRIHIRDGASAFWSVEDLSLLLKKVKSSVTREMSDTSSIEGDSAPGERVPDRWTTLYRARRSLPDRLTPDEHVTRGKTEARKKCRRRGSVKFADDFGLNLNTFVIIPARFAIAHAQEEVTSCRLPVCARTTDGCGSRLTGLDRILGKDPGFYRNDEDPLFWPDWDYAEIRIIRKEKRESKDTRSQVFIPDRFPKGEFCGKLDAKSKILPEVDRHDSKPRVSSIPEFHLCFEQPFADLEKFQRKLRWNFLCLENVRVDDRSAKEENNNSSTLRRKGDPGSEQHLRPNQGTTILCSIKVRRSEHLKTVFGRCTDNEWSSYADLPAQQLHGTNNLGLDYVTFCFAVRKPVRPPPPPPPPPPRNDGSQEAAGRPPGPTSAVEFAVCAVVSTRYGNGTEYWDNNEGANYRIEWFD